MTKPFSNLLKKEMSFEWKEEKQKTFDNLKEKLFSTPMLKFLNFTKLFKVHTNASDFIIGGVFMQMDTQLFLKVKSSMESNYNGWFMKRVVYCRVLPKNVATLLGDA